MQLDNITLQVCELCGETARYISAQAAVFRSADIEEKGLKNLVSYVDRKAEEMLVAGLEKVLPGSEFIAEEHDYQRRGGGYTWIIDPLDGTTNFIHGLPLYSISVGLMKDETLIAGVVFEVPHQECFYAWEGSQAFLNGTALKVSRAERLEKSLLVTGFPYDLEGKLSGYIGIFSELIERSRGVRRLGSAAIDLCYVAAGRMDGFYEYGLNPWDVAAGAVILRQAGGRISDFDGTDQYIFGKELVATNGLIHDELLAVIEKHFH